MEAVIAAYFALVVLMLTAAFSAHDLHASRLKALDNAYLAAP